MMDMIQLVNSMITGTIIYSFHVYRQSIICYFNWSVDILMLISEMMLDLLIVLFLNILTSLNTLITWNSLDWNIPNPFNYLPGIDNINYMMFFFIKRMNSYRQWMI